MIQILAPIHDPLAGSRDLLLSELAHAALGCGAHRVAGGVVDGHIVPDPNCAVGADGELVHAAALPRERFDGSFDFDGRCIFHCHLVFNGA